MWNQDDSYVEVCYRKLYYLKILWINIWGLLTSKISETRPYTQNRWGSLTSPTLLPRADHVTWQDGEDAPVPRDWSRGPRVLLWSTPVHPAWGLSSRKEKQNQEMAGGIGPTPAMSLKIPSPAMTEIQDTWQALHVSWEILFFFFFWQGEA